MTTHGVVPEVPIMAKQQHGYGSPLSFTGATRRILAWLAKDRNTWPQVFAWAAVVIGLPVVWALLLVWYVLIFGVFGLLVIPYRLVRRSQRKEAEIQRAQLATMQAMMAGQMKAQERAAQEDQGGEGKLRAVQ